MLKKTVTYVDFNGNEIKEDCYFHFNRREALKLAAKFGDIQEYANKLASEEDLTGIIEFFEYILLNSYGKRSSDGRSFVKSPEVKEAFEYSLAYAELFELLISEPEEAKTFAEGISLQPEVKQAAKPNDHQEANKETLSVVSPDEDTKQREGESQEAYIKRLQKQLGKR